MGLTLKSTSPSEQFSLGESGTQLLQAGLGLLLATIFLVALKLLSELRRRIITTSLIETICLSASALTLVYAILEGGLFLSTDVFDSELFGFILLICSSTIMVVLLVLQGPIVLTTLETFLKRLSSIGNVVNLLLKPLLVGTLILIVLANLPLGFSDATSWLDEDILGILLTIVLLFIVVRISDWAGNRDLTCDENISKVSEERNLIHENKIWHLHLGVFAGLIGIFAGGLVIRTIALSLQNVYTPAFILCGALGGLGFGLLTSGNNKLRGIFGCVFGFIAILFGLVMTYGAPIVVGYMSTYSSGVTMPIYKWHEFSFGYFMVMQLGNMHGLFFTFFGLLTAYLGGSKLSLRRTGKKLSLKSHEQNKASKPT